MIKFSYIQSKRLGAYADKYNFGDQNMRERLSRIALLLENQTKLNVRSQRLVDTGNLLNSIRSEWRAMSPDTAVIEWGSYGVKYAAVHEYGFQGSVNIPAYSRRTPSGGSTTVRPHSRFVNFRPRPYIRPALAMHRQRILAILAEEI